MSRCSISRKKASAVARRHRGSGASSDASLVTVVFNNQASAITKPNPCVPTGTGTFATATLMAFADGFQAKNLTISNDFASPNGTFQAVALMTQADKQVYENILLHGFQDTFFLHTASVATVSRVYVKNSFIEGDTDFIFGRATAVLDACTINDLSSRRSGGAGGAMLAPSTVTSNNYGFLVIGSSLTALSGTASGVACLGRAWDNSGRPPMAGRSSASRSSARTSCWWLRGLPPPLRVDPSAPRVTDSSNTATRAPEPRTRS